MMRATKFCFAAIIGVPLIFSPIAPAKAQQVYAYPKAGQSQQQQAKDRSECHHWAIGQTGYDPSRPPAPTNYAAAPPPQTSSGPGVLGGAARGAAVGAVGGAIGGNAGKGAAIGSLAGALFGGVKRRSRQQERDAWERQRQQQMQQQQQQNARTSQQGAQKFTRAFAACMTARKYQVQ